MPTSPSRFPARPSVEQLRKQAKERLASLRAIDPSARLADAQNALARDYGFAWSLTSTGSRAGPLSPKG